MIESVFRSYSQANVRNPFVLSLSTWLALSRDAGLGALVDEHERHSAAGCLGASGGAGGGKGGKGDGRGGGSLGSLSRHSSIASIETSDGLDGHVDLSGMSREAKMGLEVVFHTATGDTSGDDDSDSGGAAAVAASKGRRKKGAKTVSALQALQFGKQELRRRAFVLALLALARCAVTCAPAAEL